MGTKRKATEEKEIVKEELQEEETLKTFASTKGSPPSKNEKILLEKLSESFYTTLIKHRDEKLNLIGEQELSFTLISAISSQKKYEYSNKDNDFGGNKIRKGLSQAIRALFEENPEQIKENFVGLDDVNLTKDELENIKNFLYYYVQEKLRFIRSKSTEGALDIFNEIHSDFIEAETLEKLQEAVKPKIIAKEKKDPEETETEVKTTTEETILSESTETSEVSSAEDSSPSPSPSPSFASESDLGNPAPLKRFREGR